MTAHCAPRRHTTHNDHTIAMHYALHMMLTAWLCIACTPVVRHYVQGAAPTRRIPSVRVALRATRRLRLAVQDARYALERLRREGRVRRRELLGGRGAWGCHRQESAPLLGDGPAQGVFVRGIIGSSSDEYNVGLCGCGASWHCKLPISGGVLRQTTGIGRGEEPGSVAAGRRANEATPGAATQQPVVQASRDVVEIAKARGQRESERRSGGRAAGTHPRCIRIPVVGPHVVDGLARQCRAVRACAGAVAPVPPTHGARQRRRRRSQPVGFVPWTGLVNRTSGGIG
eukprot:scaffold9834_cov105-Isochrysis_galbana.AAC.9